MYTNNAYRMDDYRRDVRSLEEFKKDIAHGTKVESIIMRAYSDRVENLVGIRPIIVDNGCDNSGDYIDSMRVNTKADYLVNGRPVEVKFNNRLLSCFHLKASQLRSYANQGASILWVNGYETDTPMITIVPPDKLREIAKRPAIPFKTWGGKLAYRIYVDEFKWKPFNEVSRYTCRKDAV